MKPIFFILILFFSSAKSQSLKTISGTGNGAFLGDGGQAVLASLNPYAMATDRFGNIYIADLFNNNIRKIDIQSNIISTICGVGGAGFAGDNGPAIYAQLSGPRDVYVDADGNIFIADFNNNRIRKINPAGIISTVAGTGVPGFFGDNGPATSAQLNAPISITGNANGVLYISDAGNHRIRKVDNNMITTIAGKVPGFGGDNGPAINALLNNPNGINFDASGNLYICDANNNRIRKINLAGIITSIAGNGNNGYTGDNGPAVSASLNYPADIVFNKFKAEFYIADANNHAVRKIANNGIITTMAGTGVAGFNGACLAPGPFLLKFPYGLCLMSPDNLLIGDYGNNRLRKWNMVCDLSQPTVTISSGTGGLRCAGTPVSFAATVANGGSNIIYQWKKNGNNVGSNSPTYTDQTLLDVDKIQCLVKKDDCDCNIAAPQAWSNILTVPILPGLPTPTITSHNNITKICPGASLQLNSSGAFRYQWYKDGSPIMGASFQNLVLTSPGIFLVKTSSKLNCSSLSQPFTVVSKNPATAPLALAATAIQVQGFTANWTAVPGATDYRIDISSNPSFNPMIYSDINVGITTSFQISGLPVSTDYYYRVRSVTECGISINSNIMPVSISQPHGSIAYGPGTSTFTVGPHGTAATVNGYPNQKITVTIEVWGAGGGGSGGEEIPPWASTSLAWGGMGGSGGGGGCYTNNVVTIVVPSTGVLTYVIFVGSGGVGGHYTMRGFDGQSSYVKTNNVTIVSAGGGKGGLYLPVCCGKGGGVNTADNIGTVKWLGLDGANQVIAVNSCFGRDGGLGGPGGGPGRIAPGYFNDGGNGGHGGYSGFYLPSTCYDHPKNFGLTKGSPGGNGRVVISW